MAVVEVTTRCMSCCLCQSAQAVSDGDRERCRSLLFEARQECVRSLASVSTESVSSVNPAILQLQQLQCVQEAWAFRWPTLSLASPPSPGLVSSASSLSDHALCTGGHAVSPRGMGGWLCVDNPQCDMLMSQMALYIGNLPDGELAAGMVSAPQCSLLFIRSFTADCNGLYVQAVTSAAAEGSLQLANMQALWRSREAAMGRLEHPCYASELHNLSRLASPEVLDDAVSPQMMPHLLLTSMLLVRYATARS